MIGLRKQLLGLAATVFALAAPAPAAQHLIGAGENWQSLSTRLSAGDEVILMPGIHRPASWRDVHGAPGRPIAIRSLDPKRPAVIDAGRYGIRLQHVSFIEISDVVITGASIHGLSIEGQDPESKAPLRSEQIKLKDVKILETGPVEARGHRHAVLLRDTDEVRVERCSVVGWGGSGLEIIGCTSVDVRDSIFRGDPRYYQITGVRMRAGSERIYVRNCEFAGIDDQNICIGGRSGDSEFRPAAMDEEPVYEANRVRIMECVLNGSLCAVSFVHARDARVRNCTIVNPQRAVFSLRNEQQDSQFGGQHGCAINDNLITWNHDDLEQLVHLGPDTPNEGIIVGENLWWSVALARSPDKFGPFPGEQHFPQVTKVNPELRGNLVPDNVAARRFGVPLHDLAEEGRKSASAARDDH